MGKSLIRYVSLQMVVVAGGERTTMLSHLSILQKTQTEPVEKDFEELVLYANLW